MSLDQSSFLDLDEIRECLTYADRRAATSKNFRLNRVVFRLSCCAGLRTVEIVGLNLADVVVEGKRPLINVRPEVTKGKNGVYKARRVPLWWDSGTLDTVASWWHKRVADGAGPGDPFVCYQRKGQAGERIKKRKLAMRWSTVLKCLPEARQKQLSIHKGRHSAATHALAAGRSLVEVQRMLGHASINSTNVYTHLIDRENVPDVFAAV